VKQERSGSREAFPTTFPTEIPNSFPTAITDRYEIEYITFALEAKVKEKLGSSVKSGNFAALIAAIRADANTRYPGGGFECP
jgi:hypothetical protein